MRIIRLQADAPFFNNVDVKVIDITEKKERQRATFQMEYAEIDVKPYLKQGLSLEQVLEKYKQQLEAQLRLYLAGDFEIIDGLEEVLTIVKDHIRRYFL